MSAAEAAGELGISLPTLYAYVSRGLVRSEPAVGDRRGRRYRAEDVRRLKERAARRRDPDVAAEGALAWGSPVMESAITLISDGRLYYQGRDATVLAAGRSIEEVAALIWTGDSSEASAFFGGPSPSVPPRLASIGPPDGLAPIEVFQLLLTLAAAEDPLAYDLRAPAVARAGARILRLMAAVSVGEGGASGDVAETLRRGWAPEEEGTEALLGAALVLCADHELPVSTFAARCVASAGANPYAVVAAGLCAMRGVNHGGQVELVEAFLGEVEATGDALGVVGARLRRGERVPGFGHPLYPDGDPRGAALLRLVEEGCPRSSPALPLVADTVREVGEIFEERPNVDFGLVALARGLGLPPGSALALFALGRTVGWIGHAIEQYERGALIRPRSRYVGEPPMPEAADGPP